MHNPAGYSSLRRIGDLKHSLRPSDHDGWILLDGRTIKRSSYPRFFQALALDGTSVALPNARDLLLLGAGGRLKVMETGGSNEITLTVANLPAHRHAADKVTAAATNPQKALLTGLGLGDVTKPPTVTIAAGAAETGAAGKGEPVRIEPKALGANVFVYVGEPVS